VASRIPRLTVRDFDDATRLAEKIELVLRADDELRRRARLLRRLRNEVRSAVGDGHLNAYVPSETRRVLRLGTWRRRRATPRGAAHPGNRRDTAVVRCSRGPSSPAP